MQILNEYRFINRSFGPEHDEHTEIAVVNKDDLRENMVPSNIIPSLFQRLWQLENHTDPNARSLMFDEDFTANYDGTLVTNESDLKRYYEILEKFRDSGFSGFTSVNGLRITNGDAQNDWARYIIRQE